jgi:hypothetical protein
MKPRLIVKQKITALVNKYTIAEVNPDGTAGQLLGLAQQKRIALREKVIFYTDESRSKVAFTFRAEKVLDVHGRYFVEDANGKLIGGFRKNFGKSLINSTWHVFDAAEQEVFLVKESNHVVAVLRRFGGMIPVVGDIIEMTVAFLKYHFTFIDSVSQAEVGQYRKTTLFRDHYELLMDDSGWSRVDWRVMAAMSVALDALQSR